ncbi:dienelactone hydrolase [Nitratireductor sp. CAU 1489]|uniref:Dienelactone hydrolase n=1 Tax=Nitratireductor arenosus TaxID=2682096 RepID=A0A844QGA8_9HYPH|nr:dienelactone hydrolase [Nitratireductor arenosus]MVA97021.1 dienelactone hydrolase [Nitratireductor arenosus]
MRNFCLAATVLAVFSGTALAQENRIDRIRPDAPELAAFGPHAIGVRTLELVHADQIDIVNLEPGKPHPRYDRPLTVEIWYPATGSAVGGTYQNVYLRDGRKTVTLEGRAVRDATPKAASQDGWPLVLISHGYPGNRFLLSHLAENLATKGYVVASVDHTDSTYHDQSKFGSTLVNRPFDQLFVLDEIARLSADTSSFLSGLVDAETTGLIGYSMGGYGAVITAGGGVTQAATELSWGAPDGTLSVHLAGSETHRSLPDPRIKAVLAFAPWGMERGFWDAEGLAGIKTPIFFVAGSVDDVSGYENGVKAIYEQAVNAERLLLTFDNANHNAAAPMPAPAESWSPVDTLDFVPFEHYADPVWDTVRMNNVAQHFATAYFGLHLKGRDDLAGYLDLVENAGDGVWAVNEDGSFKPEHSYWKGFANRTAKGLSLIKAAPAGK